jgi:tRNA (mo5U34)-methyltransferase
VTIDLTTPTPPAPARAADLPAAEVERLRREADRIWWFHTMDLGHGIVTPGYDPTPRKLARLRLPESLAGKSVLDIGAWDGFFSFEAERRGASRVLATDSYVWQGRGKWGSKAGFELARQALGSRVEDMEIDVMELAPERVGMFDVVLLLGVLYHMRHPLLALERAASVTRELLIVETATDLMWMPRPAAAFYPADELGLADPGNWWAPNLPGLVGMLRAVGFAQVEVASSYGLASRLYRATRERLRGRGFLTSLAQGRAVAHARRIP